MSADDQNLSGTVRRGVTIDFGFRDLVEFASVPPPEPVLWRDGAGSDDTGIHDPVVCVGEPGLLSGAGGAGKTWLAFGVALSAVRAMAEGAPFAATCGVRVRAGRVAYMSFETWPERLYEHAQRMGEVPRGLYLPTNPEPVARVERRSGKISSVGLKALAEQLEPLKPSLLILDTAADAFSGASDTDTEPVRLFIRHLASLSINLNCGVLMVCHDTKSARDQSSRLLAPGAGAVAGSRSWHDRSRSVLYLVKEEDGGSAVLGCIKSNEGASHWGAILEPEKTGSGRQVPGMATFNTGDARGAARDVPETEGGSRGQRTGR